MIFFRNLQAARWPSGCIGSWTSDFYRRGERCEFDLKEFALEHAGLARGYDTANLKRKLRGRASPELERKGFLKPMPESERFRSLCSGQWRVVFEQATREKVEVSAAQSGDQAALVAAFDRARSRALHRPADGPGFCRGPNPSPTPGIRLATGARRSEGVSKPSRLPDSAIRNEWPPRGFITQEEQAKKRRATASREFLAEERKRQDENLRETREQERQTAVAEFWQSLSEGERRQAETEALEQATPHERSMIAQAGTLGAAARKVVLDAYALKHLRSGC